MNLIIGLGNIGDRYSETRHNIGFKVVDAILNKFSFKDISKSSFKGELFKDGDNLLLKPSTYMNLSGESVSAVTNFYKIDSSDTENNRVFIIFDDLDLPFGAIRFKKGGGSGGHNGLKSIQNLDKKVFENAIRVRMGVGKPENKNFAISDYVLSKFTEEEQKCLDSWIEHSTSSIIKMLETQNWEKISSLNTIKNIQKICK
jgi:PTH1 family peptidyl-tRNA hydrolase